MSGVEAAAVLGVISSVIAIVDGTKKVYDAASSATGLPVAFREVSTRLPIVKGILESTKQHIDDSHIDTTSYSTIKTLIEACEDRAKRLKAIFDKVIPGDEDSRLTRYISAAKTLGKGERVETLMQGLMKDVLLLASKHVMELATSQQVVGLATSIKELSAIDPSLPDAALEDTAFTNNNFGNGPMTNNNVMGNQKYQANYGTGKQFQAEEQIFHMENGPVNEQNFHGPVQQYLSSHNALTEVQVQQICEDGILYQLEFDEMQERYYNIAEAHQKTFEWIYERTDLNFVQWLQGGSGVYWITGKAGAGKSTLMKFIYQNRKTHDHLSSDIENTLVSGFFFHDRGQNPLLKSQEGLFRAILHSILSRYRQLIPIALSSRYDRFQRYVRYAQQPLNAESWSINELRSALEAVVSQSQMRLHLCLLIDGLDEFSGQHDDIICTLSNLLPTSPHSYARVQMCLSSRPLAVFEEAYSRYTHLQVHHLTGDDIEIFVKTKFNSVSQVAGLLAEDPITTNLIIEEILFKAEGVFLWVTLVVQSLIDGLRNRDSMKTLQARLSALPAGLKPLYKSMIDRIDPHYHEEASRIFHMLQLAAKPLSPLAMSFSDDEPQDALAPHGHLSDLEIAKRHSDVATQLKARTAGLVEISPIEGDRREYPIESSKSNKSNIQNDGKERSWTTSQLQYLHLTVKEFLLSNDVPSWLVNGTSTAAASQTHLIIVACWLRQLQVTTSPHLYDYHLRISGGIRSYFKTMQSGIVFVIMFHAYQMGLTSNASNFLYLELLDGFLTKVKEASCADDNAECEMPGWEKQHWTSLRYSGWQEPTEWQSDYISYLVTIGMFHSTIAAFDRGYDPVMKPGRPLLLYATCNWVPRDSAEHMYRERERPEPTIVEELLKRNCDPNQALDYLPTPSLVDEGARTVWEALMSHLARHFDSHCGNYHESSFQYVENLSSESLYEFKLSWLRTIKLFLDHGANPRDAIVHYHWTGRRRFGRTEATHKLSVLSIFDHVFSKFDNPLVSLVRASMVEKGAIEFEDEILVGTAMLNTGVLPDQKAKSLAGNESDYIQAIPTDVRGLEDGRPETKSRLALFFERALSPRRSRQDGKSRSRKRDGCAQI